MKRSHLKHELKANLPSELARHLDNPNVQRAFDMRAALVELGSAIRKVRAAEGLTQEELATRIGSNKREIARIECGLGARGPTIALLQKVSREFGVWVDSRYEELEPDVEQRPYALEAADEQVLGAIRAIIRSS